MIDNNEKKQKIITVIVVLLALIISVYNLFIKKEKVEKIDTETISIVKDPNRFYTVSSCILKYINYLSIDDMSSIYTLIDNNYKEENKITESNVLNYISDVTSGAQFQPFKMYSQSLTKNITKYYVSGYILYDQIDTVGVKSDYYVIAILDEENLTFSIIPYDGEMFK